MSEVYVGPVAHSSGPGNHPIIRLVVHCTAPGLPWPQAAAAGMAVSTGDYFKTQGAGGSAHQVYDRATSVRCADDDEICWHAPPNRGSKGYEIGGEVSYTREQWLSPEVRPAIERCAADVRADAIRLGIPLVKLSVQQVANEDHGICGHVDVSGAFHQSDHTDPGPNFPWDVFMALVTGATTEEEALTPELKAVLDELKAEIRALRGEVATHADMIVLLRGTSDGQHPANITAIAKATGVAGVQ